ncbi:TPA: capsular biosynthesis protein, partial [Escherichia coli]|nr:capsular biosynthesis protein [Escherichia coli]
MTTIVIPMAGQSSRFYKAGYDVPKYKLKINNKSVFFHSLRSFLKFKDHFFLIIGIKGILDEKFVQYEMAELGINDFEIVLLEQQTNGQAETVVKGVKNCKRDISDILIFNIDTFRREINLPDNFSLKDCSGYLETFLGSGENWSNIMPESDVPNQVKMTAEKQNISEYCCTGLYYFGDYKLLNIAYNNWLENEDTTKEVYIAPLYNHLITCGHKIFYTVINRCDVVF